MGPVVLCGEPGATVVDQGFVPLVHVNQVHGEEEGVRAWTGCRRHAGGLAGGD